ncbi:Hypothetical_protein [Hexamita inflata]|uniref:Hypothetical_protein n=1 Tax=Hexamita inflata TaxID=28002 RepID=A0AA86RAG6_9EUKA|nr:Hypothetical protein HINF_LOCUS56873 [Hexamita inflata]
MTLCLYTTELICQTVCNMKYCVFNKKQSIYCCTDDKMKYSNWQMQTIITLGVLLFIALIIDVVVYVYKKQNKNSIHKKVVKVQMPVQIKQQEPETDHNEVDQLLLNQL